MGGPLSGNGPAWDSRDHMDPAFVMMGPGGVLEVVREALALPCNAGERGLGQNRLDCPSAWV